MQIAHQYQWELTERECLAGVLVSAVWDWLKGDGQRGAVLFLGGRGGPLRLELELGTWYSKLENW